MSVCRYGGRRERLCRYEMADDANGCTGATPVSFLCLQSVHNQAPPPPPLMRPPPSPHAPAPHALERARVADPQPPPPPTRSPPSHCPHVVGWPVDRIPTRTQVVASRGRGGRGENRFQPHRPQAQLAAGKLSEVACSSAARHALKAVVCPRAREGRGRGAAGTSCLSVGDGLARRTRRKLSSQPPAPPKRVWPGGGGAWIRPLPAASPSISRSELVASGPLQSRQKSSVALPPHTK